MKFVRKPQFVDAIEVTEENIAEVAEWCKGEVRTQQILGGDGETEQYIKVKVHRPLTDRQTKAFVGDRVVYANKGYKVYPEKAFARTFDKVEESANA